MKSESIKTRANLYAQAATYRWHVEALNGRPWAIDERVVGAISGLGFAAFDRAQVAAAFRAGYAEARKDARRAARKAVRK